jgi:hypothetical protein
MKAMVQKELRENIKLAVLGMIIYGLPLLYAYLVYSGALRDLALGSGNWRGGGWQPLLTSGFLPATSFLCPLLGAALGWFQIHNERQRDLWSFLVHRPMSRTQIFVGKTVAGLTLYLLGAGVPFLLFAGWAITPGHVAAPFEWSMLLPATAMFLTGPAYYFAGMLTGLRQARWFASRAVPLTSAIVLSCWAAVCPQFGQALLVLGAGAAVLGLAAWGAFRSNGYYEGQPNAAKPALALGLVVGTSAVLAVAGGWITQVLLERWLTAPRSYTHYAILKDGTIYKQINRSYKTAENVDLNGRPYVFPDELAIVNRVSFHVDLGEPEDRFFYFKQPDQLFEEMKTTPATLWFYWARYGRAVAFDTMTRRPIGSLGPDGFTAGELGGARFDYPPKSVPGLLHPLKTATALYEVRPASRTAKAMFTTAADDPIVGVTASMPEEGSRYIALATRHFVYLLGNEGAVIWKTPYESASPDYNRISIYFLSPANNFALWFSPSTEPQRRAGGKLPERVTFLANGQSTRTVVLPNQPPLFVFDTAEKLMSFLAPPFAAAMAKCLPAVIGVKLPLQFLWFSLAGAALALSIGWWVSGRYAFDALARLSWIVFLLLFGIPGLLVLLSVQEWPAREPCPNCGRRRVVRREHCEHCDGVFGPAAPTGTEIFAPAAE